MIEIKDLSKAYDDVAVVAHLNISIPKGSVFGFLGPNGAGKTTTIKMLVGITEPSSGTILVGGHDPREKETRAHIGFMPETPQFYDYLTAIEFLRFTYELAGKKNLPKLTCDHALSMVGLEDSGDTYLGTFSKGMRQRLAFAQTLIHSPDYVFLDEPLDGLDPIGRRTLKLLIQDLRKRGKTVFFNSHILSDIEEICDMIGVVHKGKLLYAGPTETFCDKKPLEERFMELILKQQS